MMAEPIPISLVAHHVFCPRRAWLEAAGEIVSSAPMEVGTHDAKVVDTPDRSPPGRIRALDVGSERLGIVGRCDTILEEDGTTTIIEHKATPRRRSTTVTAATRVQLALQGLALAETGVIATRFAVWFSTHRRRVDVVLEPADFTEAEAQIRATRKTVEATVAPPPLLDDPRCAGCSHVGVCMPDERRTDRHPRSISVSDPGAQVVHIATPGARAYLRAGRLCVDHKGERLHSIPIERVEALAAHGNVDLSGALVRELLWRRAPILWLSGRGRLVGWATTASSPNGSQRRRQHQLPSSVAFPMAREMIATKIANQATILRRFHQTDEATRVLRRLQARASRSPDELHLLGLEGEAAAVYFAAFPTMFTQHVRATLGTEFRKRTRRPARDPVNSALNYAYGLLLAETVRAIAACGLDPAGGVLHTPTRNKPALGLDLMEEHRAPLADAVVVAALNNRELRQEHFSTALGGVRLRESGRRALVRAFERRMTTSIRHPLFGYRVTWRRALEVQARLVLGVIEGTYPSYRGVRVR